MWRTNFRNPLTIAGGGVGFGGVVSFMRSSSMQNGCIRKVSVVSCSLFSDVYPGLWEHCSQVSVSSVRNEVNAFAGSAWQMLFASVMFWICAVVNGDVREADLSTVSVTSWFSLLYLISFGSLLAYSAYVWLLKVRPAAEVGTHAYVNPFIAVLLGVSFGNEQVTFVQLSGLLVILLGVMLISRKRNKMKSTAISR